jgi:plastocyanin
MRTYLPQIVGIPNKFLQQSRWVRKEVKNMTRKVLAVLLAIAVVVAFTLPTFAQETVKGKIEALDKNAKKVTINATEYSLSDEAAQVDVAVGDEVEATVDGGVVKTLTKT